MQRYGALNVRAAMQYVRDVIWAEHAGDRPRGLPRRSSADGVQRQLGRRLRCGVQLPLGARRPRLGAHHRRARRRRSPWTTARRRRDRARRHCRCRRPTRAGTRSRTCRPTASRRTAPRSSSTSRSRPRRACSATPEQQFLHISNQIDTDAANHDAVPVDRPAFVNTLRSSYCSIRGTPGLHSFLRGSSTSIHGQLNNELGQRHHRRHGAARLARRRDGESRRCRRQDRRGHARGRLPRRATVPLRSRLNPAIARVRWPDGTVQTAELHWYEAHGVGHRDSRMKQLLGGANE